MMKGKGLLLVACFAGLLISMLIVTGPSLAEGNGLRKRDAVQSRIERQVERLSPKSGAAAPTYTVLYAFVGGETDGSQPDAGVIADAAGNLYGTTFTGGIGPCSVCGTVFEVSPPTTPEGTWTETVLYSFEGSPLDGEQPAEPLVLDATGNLYGTTGHGGVGGSGCVSGCGIVFQLSPPSFPGGKWTETVLYAFLGGADGASPSSNLVFDQAGDLYGMTADGGGSGCSGFGCGTIFQLLPPSVPGDPGLKK